jgi:serine/threonine-protein kinase
MSLSAGTRLGPYEIVAPIGAGGMGEVYRARDTRLNREVAIKISAERFSDRFEREAHSIAALNHPNICTLHDLGPNYLVMEFIDGSPLAGPVPLEVALRYAVQIADALSAAHAKGITHRDLKPANILVTASGIKLLDFGLALLSCSSTTKDDTALLGLTQEGTILGTAAYMSPEQAEAKPVDARSDIFSFGSVLYEMLSGRCAFDGDSTLAIMAAIVRDEPKPLEAPLPVQNIITRCLRKSPADRFQSMTEVKNALLAATSGMSLPGATAFGTLSGQAGSSSAGLTPSIAVLPFANMTADKAQEYFSDGLAEEIINLLAQIPGLKVIARTSAFAFRGKEQDIRGIARTLGVSTVLEGSVRRAGKRIRVTAQLISAEDGSHLLSERYDRELSDVFTMQDEIAGAIAAALQPKLTLRPSPRRQYTPNLAAYDALLLARHHLNKATPESMAQARECLEEAIAIDPGYALPHSALGFYFSSLAIYHMQSADESIPRARTSIKTALEIDPSLPEALASLGLIAAVYDYDWKEAARLFRLALASEAVSPDVRLSAGGYLFQAGRTREAIEQLERAVQADPLNLTCRAILAYCLMVDREADAERELRRVLDLDRSYYLAHHFLDMLQLQRGNIPEALASAERAFALAPWVGWVRGFLAGLLELTGDAVRAESVLRELGNGTAYGAPFGLFCYRFICGEIEQAADWVEKAIVQRDPALLYPLRLPLMEDLRRSSRWPKLARMMNLPDAV